METQIRKWGNSLGIRIPHVFAKESNIEDGTYVKLISDGKQIVIEPIKNKKKYSLNELLKSITKDNIHKEVKTGSPVGKEIW